MRCAEREISRREFVHGMAGLCALPIGTVLSGCSAAGTLEPEDYLEQHVTILDLQDEPTSAVFDLSVFGDMGSYRVFLAGGAHGRVKNYEIKKALITTLHEQAQMNDVLLEFGVGAGMILDRYLETGDEDLLSLFMAQARGTATGCVEEEEFWHWLRAYNMQFGEAERIRVHGMDVDHQTYLALWVLQNLVEADDATSDAAAQFARVLADELARHTPDESPRELLESDTFSELEVLLSDHQDDARSYFGESYELAVLLLRGHKVVQQIYESPDDDSVQLDYLRDEYMERAFKRVEQGDVEQGGEGVFFGQFGRAHMALRPLDGYGSEGNPTFAMRLNSGDSATAGKVCSIYYLYYDAWSKHFEQNTQYSTNPIDCDLFEPWGGEDAAVDLDGARSPFAANLNIEANPADGDENKSTTSIFQKAVLLANLDETTPLE